ncbi:general secretion pathway protein E [Salinisphaera orenii MK-B5]|uniref:Type II secretion system protein E n=1 Tax=Salinisphaera orenii MK-B5 TaxID=856730 RepID=A0A423PXX6_9GAMM|nr:type II secretion system ATPase GspE [Salinisphaera orenii]ROO30441.1 general secretion pathway protein E [Salinisphaera orenii MK-B5]
MSDTLEELSLEPVRTTSPENDEAPPRPPGPGPVEGIDRLPFAFAKRYGVMLSGAREDAIEVTCRRDVAQSTLSEVRRHLGRPIVLQRVEAAAFDAMLQNDYEGKANESMQIVEGMDEEMDLSDAARALSEPADLLESSDDAPIIRLINALLTEAIKENASDIHIEPFEARLTVRFRIDGVLREVLNPPRQLAPRLISRVKVMAKLDIAEKRIPQDGRISVRIAGRPVDVRVSTIPSGNGERVVMRLLDKQAGRLDLPQLGMPAETLSNIDELIHKPHGIILVTGPTGSGKTTTLYAGITRINDRSRNIMTVEDPIEYYLDGIGQTQVNSKVDMSFARGLRAILRQDPDVVMIGEIRDLETAEIAVQASLTGHLVLSTLHTNTAVGAIARLRDMGVEPFLLSSSVIGIMAQRLVRTLCAECRDPYTADRRECELLHCDPDEPPTLYRPTGCATCNGSGFRGRTGIYELVVVDDEMRNLIHEQAAEHTLEKHARTITPSIRADGRANVLAGNTTLEEVLRVTREG